MPKWPYELAHTSNGSFLAAKKTTKSLRRYDIAGLLLIVHAGEVVKPEREVHMTSLATLLVCAALWTVLVLALLFVPER